MHMAWMRYVCGLLKSDFRYSNTIVHHNFPWPNTVNSLPKSASNMPRAHTMWAQTAPEIVASNRVGVTTTKLIAKIEAAAQAVLNAHAVHQTGLPPGTAPSTLAQLYDPTTMPANLAKAHAALDKAVDAAYKEDGGATSYANDGERVAFLFKRYAALTSLV
jgi:hypothetical protein